MPDDVSPACLQLISGLESVCFRCSRNLCLRQQVLNLALGSEEQLLCLTCLAAENEKSREEFLSDIGSYVVSRECFAKEWRKYKDRADCPDPLGCLPEKCFSFT